MFLIVIMKTIYQCGAPSDIFGNSLLLKLNEGSMFMIQDLIAHREALKNRIAEDRHRQHRDAKRQHTSGIKQ